MFEPTGIPATLLATRPSLRAQPSGLFSHCVRERSRKSLRPPPNPVTLRRAPAPQISSMWLGISDDAKTLALVHDTDVWLIDRQTLNVRAHYPLASFALGVNSRRAVVVCRPCTKIATNVNSASSTRTFPTGPLIPQPFSPTSGTRHRCRSRSAPRIECPCAHLLRFPETMVDEMVHH